MTNRSNPAADAPTPAPHVHGQGEICDADCPHWQWAEAAVPTPAESHPFVDSPYGPDRCRDCDHPRSWHPTPLRDALDALAEAFPVDEISDAPWVVERGSIAWMIREGEHGPQVGNFILEADARWVAAARNAIEAEAAANVTESEEVSHE